MDVHRSEGNQCEKIGAGNSQTRESVIISLKESIIEQKDNEVEENRSREERETQSTQSLESEYFYELP